MGVFGGSLEDVFSEWQTDTVAVSAASQEIRQSESTTLKIAGALQWARNVGWKGGEIWLYTVISQVPIQKPLKRDGTIG